MEYYIDTLIDEFGFHRVHQCYCAHLPKGLRRLFLGDFDNVSLAIDVAKTCFFSKVKECDHCCRIGKKIG